MTDNTLRQQEDLVKSFEARMFVLQQENAELCQLNGQLQAEVNSVQRVASFTDVGRCSHLISFVVNSLNHR